MEAIVGQITGSASGVAGIFMLSKLLTWYYRRRVNGLVLLKGKTTLCNELSSDKLLFLDIDMLLAKMPNYDMAKTSKSDMILIHTAFKEVIDKLLRQYHKPVVFVSRSYELLRLIGVRQKKIHFVCASQEAHKKAELMYKDAVEFAKDEAQRLRLLQSVKAKNVRVFDNLADLKKKVKEIYDVNDLSL